MTLIIPKNFGITKLCDFLKGKILNPKLDIGYIDGANHNYSGKEEILAEEIFEFIKNI